MGARRFRIKRRPAAGHPPRREGERISLLRAQRPNPAAILFSKAGIAHAAPLSRKPHEDNDCRRRPFRRARCRSGSRAVAAPTQISLDNRRAALLTALTVSDSEGKVVGQLSRPLAGGKKGVLRLTRGKGCEMSVSARFDDEGEVDETVNLCREKVLRFTE